MKGHWNEGANAGERFLHALIWNFGKSTTSWEKIVLPIEWQAELNENEQDTESEVNTLLHHIEALVEVFQLKDFEKECRHLEAAFLPRNSRIHCRSAIDPQAQNRPCELLEALLAQW